MDLTKENKNYIDSLDLEDLLSKWRFAKVGDERFQGETGEYWKTRMTYLRSLPGGDVEWTKASKNIGW